MDDENLNEKYHRLQRDSAITLIASDRIQVINPRSRNRKIFA